MELITGFEPFGVVGKVLNRNPSKLMAIKLAKDFDTECLILPVNDNCIQIIKDRLTKEDYTLVFMLGQGITFRIETKDTIGNYYCGKVYREALKYNKNVIFIHLPLLFKDYSKLKEIFKNAKI